MSKHAMYRRRGRGGDATGNGAFPLSAPTVEDFSLGQIGQTVRLDMNTVCPVDPVEATEVAVQSKRQPSAVWIDKDPCTCESFETIDVEVPNGTAVDARIAWSASGVRLSDWSPVQTWNVE